MPSDRIPIPAGDVMMREEDVKGTLSSYAIACDFHKERTFPRLSQSPYDMIISRYNKRTRSLSLASLAYQMLSNISMPVCMYVCMYISMYVYINVCMYISMYDIEHLSYRRERESEREMKQRYI